MGQITAEIVRKILFNIEYKPKICLETGTRNGSSAKVWAGFFDEVHTIEVRKSAYLKAKKSNSLKNIHFYLGDSSQVLSKLIKRFNHQPVLFYLDAHRKRNQGQYNGFPIWKELDAIKTRDFRDIVVVDDVHAFGRVSGKGWEGLTVETISDYLGDKVKDLKVIDDNCVVWI